MLFNGRHGTGYMRTVREVKRLEAAERAKNVKHDRTRKHRLGKCKCVSNAAVQETIKAMKANRRLRKWAAENDDGN